jgi:hypothetical protein
VEIMNERNEQIIRDALAAQRRDRFSEGFVDRVAARWRADRSTEALMARQFRGLATVAAAAVLVLAAYNIRHRRSDEGQSIGAALFGITPRVSSTMTIDEIYGLGAVGGGG